MFRRLAEEFEKAQGFAIEIDKLRCEGCHSEGVKISFCAQCEIRACAHEKGLEDCSYCGEFPCEKGAFIWVEGSKSLENLKNQRL